MVSIIIPIYKVEAYIKKCATSLMEQTYKEIEYIFVNDRTPDNSIAILKSVIHKYPDRINNTHIINHEYNKGLPSARNTGLNNATQKYIFHCDGDDWVEDNMIEELVKCAEQNDSDIVWCDWFLTFSKNERYMSQPNYLSNIDALKGLLSGTMKYNVWNKLIKRDLYLNNQIRFPDNHGMGEDMTIIKLFACANQVNYLNKAFYHYLRTNGESFTNKPNIKQLGDILYNSDSIISFIKEKFGTLLDKELSFFKLNIKYPFLISCDRESYSIWKNTYNDANINIFDNKEVSSRCKLLQYFASKNQFWIVWIHYQLLHKVIYGYIYK